ncbi:MAG: GNAT family N-acetyltransferase [Planctomycetota bacterium]
MDHQTPPASWAVPNTVPRHLETPRLVLRPLGHDDAEGLLEAIDVDRASLLPWIPWPETECRNLGECHFALERFKRIYDGPNRDLDVGFLLGIVDRQTGTVLGGTGLHRFDVSIGEAEIGYWIRADRRREGLVTEATRHLISWAFTPESEAGWGLRRITIVCDDENTASRGVPEKLGLRLEVQKQRHRWAKGYGWTGTLGWAVLEDEWDCALHRIAD